MVKQVFSAVEIHGEGIVSFLKFVVSSKEYFLKLYFNFFVLFNSWVKLV